MIDVLEDLKKVVSPDESLLILSAILSRVFLSFKETSHSKSGFFSFVLKISIFFIITLYPTTYRKSTITKCKYEIMCPRCDYNRKIETNKIIKLNPNSKFFYDMF